MTSFFSNKESRRQNVFDRFYTTIAVLFAALASILIAAYAWGAEAGSTTQRDAPTVRFYTPDGKSAGTASTYGNQTKFYDARGNLTGTVVNNGGGKR